MDEKEEKQMHNERFAYEDVFSLADTMEAAKYLGEEGYFADDYDTLASRVEMDWSNTLDAVYPKQVKCFNSSESSGTRSIGGVNYGLFLPKDKVRDTDPEPQYRPFTAKEFKNVFKVGEVITYREKLYPHRVYTAMITCIAELGGDRPDCVWFGNQKVFLDSIFESLELLDNGQWVPFGIQDY